MRLPFFLMHEGTAMIRRAPARRPGRGGGIRAGVILAIALLIPGPGAPAMVLIHTIRGDISPKSIGYSGAGLFFAQNMMYRHTVTVYDRDFRLLKTIPDRVELSRFLPGAFSGWYRGAPVEVTFTDSGKTAWVSNYLMTGSGFSNPGNDTCDAMDAPHVKHDISYVYRIDGRTLAITGVAPAGSVPKYLAATPDGGTLYVTNYGADTISKISTADMHVVDTAPTEHHPIGITYDPVTHRVWVACYSGSIMVFQD